jgi:hypothetical protein
MTPPIQHKPGVPGLMADALVKTADSDTDE